MSSSTLSPGDHSATINGLTIHYTVLASSAGLPPLVIHPPPWGCGADLYKQVFSRLSSQYTVIIPSPRGNDSSSRPSDPNEMSSKHVVADLELLRAHWGLDKISVLGHSAGGTIALGYAITHPSRVHKLVLLASNLLGYQRRDRWFLEQMAKVQQANPPTTDDEFKAFILAIVHMYFAHPERGGPEAFRAAWTNPASLWAYRAYYGADGRGENCHWKQTAELAGVTAETLVLVGRQDRTCAPEVSEAIANGISGSQLVVLDECGHFPWMEGVPQFWEILEKFLGES